MDERWRTRLGRALAWCGVLLLAAGAWLALPRTRTSSARPPLDLFLLDVSKSVVARAEGAFAAESEDRLREWARLSAAGGRDVAVVAFGSDVRVLFPPAAAPSLLEALGASELDPARAFSQGASGATSSNLAGALIVARGLARDRALATITILSDGAFTGPDPHPLARELSDEGVAITLERTRPRSPNLSLAPLELPRQVEIGAPIVAATRVRLEPGATGVSSARVEFEARDQARVQRQTVRITFEDADTIPVHADLGATLEGLVTITAQVFVEDGARDPIPEDDRASARVRVEGSLVIGCVTPDPIGAAAWSRIPGLQVVDLRAENWLQDLARLDAVITEDLPLDPREADVLARFVERGGGWLDLAGPRWIRARSHALDLAALAPDAHAVPPRDVLFLIDASGSMTGAPFEAVRQHLADLVDAALPDDDVSVRFFAAELAAPVHFGAGAQRDQPAERAMLVAEAFSGRAPHGPTHLVRALESIVAARRGSARELLLLLLSDGRDPERDAWNARRASFEALRKQARVRVVAVAPTEDVDRDLLESVADRFVPSDGARGSWLAVFRRELVRDATVSDRLVELIAARAERDPAALILRASSAPGAVSTLVRAELVPGAQALWTDDAGRPAGAIARRGRGLCAGLAFVPGSDGARAWDDRTLLAPLVRALARSRSERADRAWLRVEDGEIVLGGIEPDFPALAKASARLENGDEITFELGAGGAAQDPLTTRTAALPAGLDLELGLVLVRVSGGAGGDLDLELEGSRGGEFAFAPRQFEPPPSAALGSERASRGASAHPFAPACLLGGLFALAAAAFLGAFGSSRT